jgi:hypothetical protein
LGRNFASCLTSFLLGVTFIGAFSWTQKLKPIWIFSSAAQRSIPTPLDRLVYLLLLFRLSVPSVNHLSLSTQPATALRGLRWIMTDEWMNNEYCNEQ